MNMDSVRELIDRASMPARIPNKGLSLTTKEDWQPAGGRKSHYELHCVTSTFENAQEWKKSVISEVYGIQY